MQTSRLSAELLALSQSERDLAAALQRAADSEDDPDRRAALFVEALAASARADRLTGLGRRGAWSAAVVAEDPRETAQDPAALITRLADRRVALDHSSAALRAALGTDAPDLLPWLRDRGSLLPLLAGDDLPAVLRAARWRWRKARLLAASEALGGVVSGVILGAIYLLGGLLFSVAARRSLRRRSRP